MSRSRTLLVFAAGVIAVAASIPSMPASAGTMTFSIVKLTGAKGGEPSIATSRSGDVYVTAPQGFPNSAGGIGLWISRDNGRSFGKAQIVGDISGGGDSDVVTPPGDDQTVYITDLEAYAAAVCVSRDKGKTFVGVGPAPDPNGCTKYSGGQAGPSNDRQWLTADRGGVVYLNYHDFTTALPQVFRSDNYGADNFTAGPCGPMITDPTILANGLNDITAGTLISKPVLDSKGNLYILWTEPTQQAQAAALAAGKASPTVSQAYLAVSTDHCASFTDYTVFDGSAMGTNSVQLGDDFNVLAIDSAGNLYAAAAGYIGTQSYPSPATANIFLFSSTDKGKTWTKPFQVTTDKGAHMLPAIVAGNKAGELGIGYYRSANHTVDPNDTSGKWVYTIAETANGTAAKPTFDFADAANGFIYHNGAICNSGLLCDTGVPGTGTDRTLSDFTSAVMGPADCPIFVWGGNPTGGTLPYVASQTDGCFGKVLGASTSAASSPSPVAAPSVAPSAAPPVSAPPSPLPNTAMAAARFAGSIGVLGLLALAGLLVTRRRSLERP